MALPDVTVEIAWDSGFATPEGDRTWTDVSAYVEGNEPIGITYGRSDELATPDPNTLTLTLDNRDGRFTPGKTTGAYYPNVAKGKPIRVTVTYNAVDYVRFTGYVDAWPLVWPDGSSSASTVTVSASSRRARLGHTATLGYSPLRYAYVIPEWPQAYWPMDRTRTARSGEEWFVDETNIGTPTEVTESRLFVFTETAALQPVFDGSAAGPVDELSMLKFPRYNDFSLTRGHYVGGASACKVNTGGEFTFEMAVRFAAPADDDCYTWPVELLSPDGREYIILVVGNDGSRELGYIAINLILWDDTATELVNVTSPGIYTPETYATLVDGELHHIAITLTDADTASVYIDGTLHATATLTGGYTYDAPFTTIALGSKTHLADLWIGHVAVRDAALTAGEIAAHAASVSTADESIEERLQRLAGYLGVPAAEVEASDSVAIGISDQSQKGRTAIEVADELAESTGGVLHDDRDGHLVMQARNDRYNQTATFTLSATTQEIEGDLEAVLDDRYLVNYVLVNQAGSEEGLGYWVTLPTSVTNYGTYNKEMELVSTSFEEVIAAASNQIVRYATPETRVSTIAVDLVNLTTSQRAAVLNADIGTLFNISSLPTQAPTDPMPLYLEGYTEVISTTGHTLIANTTPGTWFTNVAVLDDASHDQLDTGITLAY